MRQWAVVIGCVYNISKYEMYDVFDPRPHSSFCEGLALTVVENLQIVSFGEQSYGYWYSALLLAMLDVEFLMSSSRLGLFPLLMLDSNGALSASICRCFCRLLFVAFRLAFARSHGQVRQSAKRCQVSRRKIEEPLLFLLSTKSPCANRVYQ